MNCSDCGSPITTEVKSCPNCGRKFGLEEFAVLEMEKKQQTKGEPASLPLIPNMSDCIDIFEKISVNVISNKTIHPELDWLSGPVNVAISSDSMAVFATEPVSRGRKTLDTLEALASSSLGAAMLSLPILLVTQAFSSGNKKKGLDKKAFEAFFSTGNAIWVNKSSATFYFLESKGGLIFGNPGCLFAANGKFESAMGPVEICVSVSDEYIPSASQYRESFLKTSFNFIRGSVKDFDDLLTELRYLLGKV